MEIKLTYEGHLADSNNLDFYDLAQAMVGFQRSLAITTHLVINGTIITQAPALKGARILSTAPRPGSVEILAALGLLAGGLYALGTAPKDTPIGHLVYSLYDYAIKRLTGNHVDFDKSLGQQIADANKSRTPEMPSVPALDDKRVDSLLEKIEPAIIDMHRQIVKSHTASKAKLYVPSRPSLKPIEFSQESYDALVDVKLDDVAIDIVGKVSSYNINTFRGRVFVAKEKRPIPFILSDVAKSSGNVSKITRSLRANASMAGTSEADIKLSALPNYSITGRLKSFVVIDVEDV